MEHDKGNLKSRNADGTNDKVYSTNTASKNVGIHVYDSKIYCSNNRRILMVTLRPATTVNVLYADTGQVLSVIYHDEQCKYKCRIMLCHKNKVYMRLHVSYNTITFTDVHF